MNKEVRKIAVVITARPSYSRIKTALTAIVKHPGLELCLVIAGSALLKRYGSAVDVVEEDGFSINAKVFNVLEGGTLVSQAKTTGLGILELTNVFEQEQPDAVITIADRYETMATAVAASFMNIPLIHIQGGEITGNIDEKVRHSITKLADIHLVSTEKARMRVLRLGEAQDKVFVTGCPSIDLAAEVKGNGSLDFNIYERYGGVGSKPSLNDGYIIVMQHPVTTEFQQAKQQARQTIAAIEKWGKTVLWFWPNVDAGSDGTSNALRSFRENHHDSKVHFFKNMKPKDFLTLLVNSQCLVGNSSVGIREASYLGVPVVNIGSRQDGRERGPNVVDVVGSSDEILGAITSQCKKGRMTSSTIYGKGEAGTQIADIIAEVPLTFHKKLNYKI